MRRNGDLPEVILNVESGSKMSNFARMSEVMRRCTYGGRLSRGSGVKIVSSIVECAANESESVERVHNLAVQMARKPASIIF